MTDRTQLSELRFVGGSDEPLELPDDPPPTPRRIQRRRTRGWRMPPGAVNCTRPSDWSNPFRIGATIQVPHASLEWISVTIDRPLAVALFAALIRDRGWEDQIRRELRGKDLVCWCDPENPDQYPCHVDLLLQLANPKG